MKKLSAYDQGFIAGYEAAFEKKSVVGPAIAAGVLANKFALPAAYTGLVAARSGKALARHKAAKKALQEASKKTQARKALAKKVGIGAGAGLAGGALLSRSNKD